MLKRLAGFSEVVVGDADLIERRDLAAACPRT
jgi:hypothetical protein